jgi:predicted SnoaL-like aldol condensation-catalyzing enzyme
MSNRAIVLDLIDRGLVRGDKRAIVDLVAEDYIQHNPTMPTGREPLLAFPPLAATTVRVLADGDRVATHSEYRLGDRRMVAFDIFRLVDGRIAEHWDAMQEFAETNASGRTMLDGPTEVADRERTGSNKAHVGTFVEVVLIGGQFDRTAEFIHTTDYAQHNPNVGDGLESFFQFAGELARRGISFRYHTLHHLIGEGNFVLTAAEGEFGGQPTAFYDLFRIEEGLIVEHWDVIQPIPATMPHDNGMF